MIRGMRLLASVSCLLVTALPAFPQANAQQPPEHTAAPAEHTAAPKDPKIQKIAFLGNSITLHGPNESIGWSGNWGMAASAPEKDYVHLVTQSLSQPAPLAPNTNAPKPPDTIVRNIADFERQFATYSIEENLKEVLEFKPTLIILAIGENVPALTSDESIEQFHASVTNLLKTFQRNGTPLILVRSCFWPCAEKDQALKKTAEDVGAIFLDIGKLAADEANFARSERSIAHAGVAGHPGDKGMKAIADAMVDAIKKHDPH